MFPEKEITMPEAKGNYNFIYDGDESTIKATEMSFMRQHRKVAQTGIKKNN